MPIADDIRNLVVGGKTRQALTQLTKWMEGKDDDLYNQLILLQGQWNRNERDSRMGVLSHDEDNRNRNRINHSLLSLLSEVENLEQTGASPTTFSGTTHQGAPAAKAAPKEKLRLFISYAREDEDWVKKLKKHMTPLRRRHIDSWDDSALVAGQEWNEEISRMLREADIILLMVSPDFLGSDYIYDVELKEAMQRHERGDAVVIPTILRPADWSHEPFAKLQALPRGARPIASWNNEDEAFVDAVQGIRRVIESLKG